MVVSMHPNSGFIKSQSVQNYEQTKCNFGAVNFVKANLNLFSANQISILSNILQRPSSDTSFVSPSGKFRIHYKKSGFDAPGYDLSEIGKSADSVYNYEVNKLGYPPPPKDGVSGGDDKYDIYILNLSSGLYGYTEFDTQISENKYTSFTVIDNDYSQGYNTIGIDGAKVTIAHEFHHAIQIGNYGFRSEDQYYYEITSTAMEEFVYDSINDYYHEAANYFLRPFKSLPLNNGYNLAVWNIYLKDRFGIDVIKEIWEQIETKRAAIAMSDVLVSKGSSFKEEFNKFGLWTYFTNSRAVPGKYFEEAANYPLLRTNVGVNLGNTEQKVMINSEPISNNFITIADNLASPRNEIVAIITNSDIASSMKDSKPVIEFNYRIARNNVDGFRRIVDNYYSKIESANNSFLAETNVFNNIPVNNGQIITDKLEYAFPQPFYYSKHSTIFFPVQENSFTAAELSIFTIDMDLVFNSTSMVIGGEKLVCGWNARDNNGNPVKSGVYIYVTNVDGKILKGKFVVFN
jgi:hypothetical protein